MWIKPPESTHERLNRELWRQTLSGWKAWVIAAAIVVVLPLAMLRGPQDITHVRAEARSVASLLSESGPYQRLSAVVDGKPVDASMASRLISPLPGDTVCLRRSVDGWTGAIRYALTEMRLCNETNSTPIVE